MLISREAMSKAKVKIDLANNQITWEGIEMKAVPTRAGHLCDTEEEKKEET